MRGSIYNHLGTALRYLGERERDPSWLKEASEAFVNAQASWLRESNPFEWAAAQNNLANVLRAKAERSGDAADFRVAIDAHREVLEIISFAEYPYVWARAHNNIGLSILGLARSELGESVEKIGKYYQEAASCFRAAISGVSRTDDPIIWAEFQNNLSTSLVGVGECFFDVYSIQAAVKASRLALEEARRERAPAVWARFQANLGNALRTLGEFSRDLTVLNDALVAYQESLLPYSETSSPIDWAKGNDNIAGVLVSIADIRGKGTVELEEAIRCAECALRVFEGAEAGGLAAVAKNNITRAKTLLSKRNK